MLHRLRKQAKGFTLLELLIVVAIIGILAAIAIPNLLNASVKSKYSRAVADTKLIVSQATLYNNDNPGATPAITDVQNGNYMSKTTDPFAANGTDNYIFSFGAASATNPIRAHSVGKDQIDNNSTWSGTVSLGGTDDVGYSSAQGCSVGTGASTWFHC